MGRINHIQLTNKGIFLVIILMGIYSQASADEALSSTIDCSEVAINYIDRPDMTRSERLEAMDKAFFESVNRFELCHLSNQSSSSQASSTPDSASAANQASSTGNAAAAGGAESESSGTGVESVASPLMTGTETESTLPPLGSSGDSGMSDNASGNAGDGAGVVIYGNSGANGALPEDIPDANNDDVVASQIRLAAKIEKDPIKKEKLWNEYRKYKGLPVKGNEQ